MADKEISEGLFDHRRRPRPSHKMHYPYGFFSVLTLLLVYLKVTEHFNESWFWVFMPLYWPIILGLALLALVVAAFITMMLLVVAFFSFEEITAAWRRATRNRN